MDVFAFILGVLLTVIFLPICFILIVSIRRSILDGYYISNLSSKYILITGCDTGFGFELAKRLDSLGCQVVATCLTKEGQDRLKEIASSRMTTISMDVTEVESIEAAETCIQKILPSADALWGIVNNAGIASGTPGFEFETLHNMKRISDVNLWGTVAVTKTFLPYLKKSKGRIVNMCSLAGRFAATRMTAYAISKFGVNAFSDCIRLELSLFGISVHIIEPDAYKTNIVGIDRIDSIRNFWDNASKELRQEYGEAWLDATLERRKGYLKNQSDKVYEVINCMEHALLSRNPKNRYFPSNFCSWFGWWFPLLPADISDGWYLKWRPQAIPAILQSST